MNIYKLTRTYEKGDVFYDSYDGAIVIAASAEEARKLQPDERHRPNNSDYYDWVAPERVTVELIGTLDPAYTTNHPDEVNILSSFNAG